MCIGKPKYNADGRLINKPYAKTQVFNLTDDDGLLTLLRQAKDGLSDDRDINKNYKKTYTLPDNGFIFKGNTKIAAAKVAVEQGNEEELKRASSDHCISPAAVTFNINKVKDYLLEQDKQMLIEKKDEIDQKLNDWIEKQNNVNEEGKMQRLAEIQSEYMRYQWVRNITSHSFKRCVA